MVQIARISCTTVVCPAGLFMVNEEGGLEDAEEYSQLPAREMGATANWSHRCGQLQDCPLCQRDAAQHPATALLVLCDKSHAGTAAHVVTSSHCHGSLLGCIP
jgi:hypothetical protein